MASIPVLAGISSTVIFAASMLPMLAKAHRTRDLSSYSRGNLVMANVGNAVHSFYVYSLPPGPIWALHAFYTATSALMLLAFLRTGAKGSRAAAGGGFLEAVSGAGTAAGSGEQALRPGLTLVEPGRAGQERRPGGLDVLVEVAMPQAAASSATARDDDGGNGVGHLTVKAPRIPSPFMPGLQAVS